MGLIGDPAGDLEQFARALVEMKLAYEHQLVGCSEAEVAEVLAAAGDFSVPEEYRVFLRRLGRQAGRLLLGTHFYYPAIVDLPEWVADYVTLDAPDFRTRGRFFIGSHQGYRYYFFEQDDPGAVYCYVDGEAAPVRAAATLLEFLRKTAADEASVSLKGVYGDTYPS
ncbi:SMI1/KNR4 family protein [Saccharothrix obliqua]|uniref:SMI1/KNR4 family protein n=1 Tax=Saccharothrix obliqua TaxID=2861747 RepID=UPI001C5EBADA|nr:SMI1/KNR4 family protein [Saccharothrix obliqua]MBW4719973.1 SMI1/KNR4 family protein [Saccharothrix obliqua]